MLVSIFKAQGGPRDNPEYHSREKASQNETINCSGKTIHPLPKMIFNFLFWFFPHSYQPLHPNLLWVLNFCPRYLNQHQPNLHRPILKRSWFQLKQPMLLGQQKMRILPLHFLMLPRYLLKTLNFIQFSPFSNHLSCQILPEETFTQEQESDSPSIENDPIDVVTQTIESLV